MFLPSKIEIEFLTEKTVLDLAIENNISLNHSCGGSGTCTTCRIEVKSDLSQMPERDDFEKESIEGRLFTPEERLGCQLKAYDGLIVKIPDEI